MNSEQEALTSQFTVLNRKHQLTAKRPVKVVTFADEDLPEELVCGMPELLERAAPTRPHRHEYYELTLCLEDGGIHETQAGHSSIKRGTVFVLAPGEVHGFSMGRGSTVICDYLAEWLYPDVRGLLDEMGFVSLFLCKAVFGEACRPEVPQWNVDDETLKACIREFRDIAQECGRKDPSHTFLRSCLKKVMVRLYRASKTGAALGLSPTIAPVLRSALLHIEDCVLQGTPFRVSALADECHLKPDRLSKSFKEATGSSPMDYYQHRRLQQACSSLLGTSRTVTEVAHALGYCDAAHFTHLFKRYQGTTPSEYRRSFGK